MSGTLRPRVATSTIVSYQWYEGPYGNTSKPIGTNSSSLTVTPGSTKSYWARVHGACRGLDSAAALISVAAVFTVHPANTEACSSANATFTATATGDPATIT